MNNKLMFSSKSDDWETPFDFFKKLDDVFKFNIDVCASEKNKKCKVFFSAEENGLKQKWAGTCWMNPPYGRNIKLWVEKASKSAKDGATVVALLPARVDTAWWHDHCAQSEIFFLRGRLKFGGHKNSAPFPSAVVVFRPRVSDALSL